MRDKRISICPRHPEVVMMVHTMAFKEAELWCPFCGYKTGLFGNVKTMKSNPVIEEALRKVKERDKLYRPFLDAQGTLSSSRTTWFGKTIPPADLPAEEKLRLQQIVESFQYGQKEFVINVGMH